MERNEYRLSTLLAGIVAVILLGFLIAPVIAPAIILPPVDIPNLVLVSLIALLADYFVKPGAKRNYPAVFLFSAVTFGLLPMAAGLAAFAEVWKLALMGSIVFTVTTFLFTSLLSRLSTGRSGKTAAVAGALGLYLAAQCFLGISL